MYRGRNRERSAIVQTAYDNARAPNLISDPGAMVDVMKKKLCWFVGAVLVLGALLFVAPRKKKAAT